MKSNRFKTFSIILFVIAIILLTLIAIPMIQTYNDAEAFKAFIDSFGVFGFLVLLFIQISQVIVALIPGELIEFVSGAVFGWLGGLFLCLLGIIIGQIIIFSAVRFFGSNLVEKAGGSKVMTRYKFLHDEKRLKTVIFILYFIPGTPKDLLTYIVPLTKIKIMDFIIISTIARIPSVLSSTYGGDAFTEKDYVTLIIVYSAIAVISLLGILVYRLIDNKRKKDD